MDWELMAPGSLLIAGGVVGIWISYANIAETFLQGLHAISAYCLLIGVILFPGGLLKDGLPSPKGAAAAGVALVITMMLAFTIAFFLRFFVITPPVP